MSAKDDNEVSEEMQGAHSSVEEHLNKHTCPVCKGPQSQCDHLFAFIDLTERRLGAGSLGSLFYEVLASQREQNEDWLRHFCDFLESRARCLCYRWDDSDENDMRPMSSSANIWFWAEDPEKAKGLVRDRYFRTGDGSGGNDGTNISKKPGSRKARTGVRGKES